MMTTPPRLLTTRQPPLPPQVLEEEYHRRAADALALGEELVGVDPYVAVSDGVGFGGCVFVYEFEYDLLPRLECCGCV